jgi:hypothetical protein
MYVEETEARKDYAGEGQQQFNQPTEQQFGSQSESELMS